MTMMHVSNSRQTKDFAKTFASIAVLFLLCGIVFLGPWVRDTLSTVLWGAQTVQDKIPLPRTVLESRLAAAEDELVHIRYQSVLYKTQAERVQKLENELGLRPRAAYLSAAVIAAPPRTHYDTLLIMAGSSDGVLLGDTVSVGGIDLGMVTAVSDKTATVQLFSSPGTTIDSVVGDTNAIIVATGVGGGALEASAPGELSVAVGDSVSEARSGAVFGVVASIVRREVDTEQYLMITTPVAPSSIRLVSLTHTP